MPLDLFGEEREYEQKPIKQSRYQLIKKRNKYRPKENDQDKCGNCLNHILWRYRSGRYHKCKLIGESHSTATDIRVNYVCDKFEKQ